MKEVATKFEGAKEELTMNNQIMHGNTLGELILLGLNDNWDIFHEKFLKLDIYYSKEYVELFAKLQGGFPTAVFYRDHNGQVFYPFIKREVDIKKGYFDIITPYGYGGPVIEGDHSVIKPFYSLFRDYCLNNNIITETIGLHPLLKNNRFLKDVMPVDYIRKTIIVDLTLPIVEIRNNYSNNNKRNIRKAIKEGVTIQISNNKEGIEEFIDLYYETMDRNRASNFYYFNRSYFYGQMNSTKLSETYLLLAKYNDKTIGGILLIAGKEFAHYHLGASKTEYLHLRPNNLLFDSMIELSKKLKLKAIHLGGGYNDKDNLFKFKASFTNSPFLNYYLGKNIINEKIYTELTKSIKKVSKRAISNFFPVYREL